MEFKTTRAKDKIYYFINSRRVKPERYELFIILCQMKNMKYNSSYLWTNKKGTQRAGFCYN